MEARSFSAERSRALLVKVRLPLLVSRFNTSVTKPHLCIFGTLSYSLCFRL